MIIGLTGTLASGKGTVAEYLIGKGFQYCSLSDELRLLLRKKGIAPNRDNLVKAGNELRARRGSGFLAQIAIKRLKGADSIVDSIRSPAEISILQQLKGFCLVAVDAPVDVRYERARQRASARDPDTFSEFLVHDQREMSGKDNEQQLAACMAAANFKITNDGDYKKLYKQIEKVLKEAGKKFGGKDVA